MPNTAKAIYTLETAVIFYAFNSKPKAYFKILSKWHVNLGFKLVRDLEETTKH